MLTSRLIAVLLCAVLSCLAFASEPTASAIYGATGFWLAFKGPYQ